MHIYCNELPTSDESKICAFVNGKCIENYGNCEDYKGKDKNVCESIYPYEEYSKKCVLEGDKCIEKEKTSCSDYKSGEDEEYCQSIKLADQKKQVFILMGIA